MLANFKKLAEDAKTEGEKDIAYLERTLEDVNIRSRSSPVGTPQYYEWTTLRSFINLEIRIQFDRMLNANYHYTLALQTAIAIQAILQKESPTLAEEKERIEEDLRKTLNDQLAKKVAGFFSDEGHEAMYGHA